MHAQRSYPPDQVDAAILGLLLDESIDLWAVAEVEREIGSKVAVADSLLRLRGAGLIYHLHGDLFVKPSRAAIYFNRLDRV